MSDECKFHIMTRSMNKPHMCSYDPVNHACVFACDWGLARCRCKYYEPCVRWALFANTCGYSIKISDNFDSEKEACNCMQSWMKNVIVDKV